MTDTTAPDAPTTTRGLSLIHDGNTYTGQAARIESTHLAAAATQIIVSWKGTRMALPLRPITTEEGVADVLAAPTIAGVQTWEQLPGSTVVILFTLDESGTATAHGIAHAIDDVVLITNPPIVEKPKTRTRSPRKPTDHQEPAPKAPAKRTRTKASS